MTEDLRLRPVAEQDLARIEKTFDDPDEFGEFNWTGYRDSSSWRRQWADNRLLGQDRSVLVIDVAGDAAGFVSWYRVNTGLVSNTLQVGLTIWPEYRSKGFGTAVLRQLAEYLFAHTTVHRVQGLTEVDNVAAQRALDRAGFTREAVLREISFRDGAWHDEVVYSMLRHDLST